MVGRPMQTLLVLQLTQFLGEVPTLGNTNPTPPVDGCLTVSKLSQVFTTRKNQVAEQ